MILRLNMTLHSIHFFQPTSTAHGIPIKPKHSALANALGLVSQPPSSACVLDVVWHAGAEVRRVRPVSITHPDHPVNVARRRAMAEPQGGALFADQFENLANFRAHLTTGGLVGPPIGRTGLWDGLG